MIDHTSISNQIVNINNTIIQYPELEQPMLIKRLVNEYKHNQNYTKNDYNFVRYSHYLYLILNVVSQYADQNERTAGWNKTMADMAQDHHEMIKLLDPELSGFYDNWAAMMEVMQIKIS